MIEHGARVVAFRIESTMQKLGLTIAVAILLQPLCLGVELQLYFSALQRVLSEQIFTAEGRLYVRGDPKNRCNFAFLEKPVISAENGRLLIKARFSGRAAQNLFGRCIGLGDSFDVAIAAMPQFRDGSLALRDVHVDSPGRDGFYIRRVRAGMADSLSKQFKYNVAAEAKRVLETSKPPVRQELRHFDVREIRVLADSVIFVLEFQLAVR